MKTLYKILFVFLLSTAVVKAQINLVGIVTDINNKEPLIGAHVRLNSEKVALTNEYGRYSFHSVGPGTYKLEVTFIGYDLVVQEVQIENGQQKTFNVQMRPGELLLSDITVSGNYDRPINTLSQVDINLRPINTSQDVLRMIPGLFIAQHAGGGKAEQIFLRGFDIDHGTDINLEVDGLPVNMVSHAHGQGYSDLHFLIPELINYVDFDKGPYYADKGDFTTAGYVSFVTKNLLERNFIKAEGGQFGTVRTVAGVNLLTGKTNAYLAGEYFHTDGFFESLQHFNRLNVVARINSQLGANDFLTATASLFKSSWDASGQIPERAVKNGMITRYGSIDDSEGGNTGRVNLYLKHGHTFSNGGFFEQQLYVVKYDFDLFSNFTFYLNDPVNCDEIKQEESRMIYGYKASYLRSSLIEGKELQTELGAGFRYDDVNDISLSHAIRREFLNDVQRGDLNEANVNVFINENLSLNDQWSLNAALRFDHFYFMYRDKLLQTDKSQSKSIVSPKFSLNYQANDKMNFYLRTGIGFHSNDVRVVVEQDGKEILPKAYGIDLGADLKVTDNLLVHAALWRLDLQQEFVYVGDEGVVEPSGRTKREGIDLSLRYQLLPWLFFDGDVNYSRPRSKDDSEGENYIPLAPTFTSIGGLTFKTKTGFNGSLRYRYMDHRPANEDNSVVAEGYFLTDMVMNYTRPKYEVGFSIQNLFNTEWKEAQFDTESRLQDETEPVSEIHFTPGTPFFIKLQATFFF